MSKKQKNETSAKAPVKLTRAEKKEIQAVIRKYKGDGKPHSAQASIPYEAMYQDGVYVGPAADGRQYRSGAG